MRNRRYVSRRGPLIVYGTEGAKLVKSFRNVPGVEIASVHRLNLLQLAPGEFPCPPSSAIYLLSSAAGM